jgi:hypothetical protein
MARVRKNHYKVGQDVVFIWSGRKKLGVVEERRPRNKKVFYNVRCDDGKLYEELYVDNSEIAAILSYETSIVGEALKKQRAEAKEAVTIDVTEEFESLDDTIEDN